MSGSEAVGFLCSALGRHVKIKDLTPCLCSPCALLRQHEGELRGAADHQVAVAPLPVAIIPDKTDTPLIVDTNTVLPRPIQMSNHAAKNLAKLLHGLQLIAHDVIHPNPVQPQIIMDQNIAKRRHAFDVFQKRRRNDALLAKDAKNIGVGVRFGPSLI